MLKTSNNKSHSICLGFHADLPLKQKAHMERCSVVIRLELDSKGDQAGDARHPKKTLHTDNTKCASKHNCAEQLDGMRCLNELLLA